MTSPCQVVADGCALNFCWRTAMRLASFFFAFVLSAFASTAQAQVVTLN